ncbi:MAG: transposase [Candidatus Nanoarchaeia archaeon]|jgi:transposase|nr:transposase [Candidatus Nanoarchaeia archaeon]
MSFIQSQSTKEKRKKQLCKIYEVKIDMSRLSKDKLEFLNRLFLEAKWWYNFCLSQKNIFSVDCKLKKVSVMNKEREFEEKDLRHLSSSMRAKIYQKIIYNIKGLATKKKKNEKVGKLKFKSEINSIPGNMYVKSNSIKIENYKKVFKVRGLKQIPENSEISSIRLIRKPFSFFFHITTFQQKQERSISNQTIGCDLGIKNILNFSNGIKIDTTFKNNKIRLIQKKISRQIRNSKNKFKSRMKIRKEYLKINNQKEDVSNKITSYLKNNFDFICIQNDNLVGWQRLYGRKISSTIIGRILDELRKTSKTIFVDRYFPSTQICPLCSSKTKFTLSERMFKCHVCGFEEDRDIKSAKLIKIEGLSYRKIPMVYGDFKLVENKTSSLMFDYFKTIPNIKVSLYSMKQEDYLLDNQYISPLIATFAT